MKHPQPDQDNTARALVRVADQPPEVLPAIILEDVMPFPGPVAPILLHLRNRRDAVLHAKNSNGFLVLVNRQSTLTKAASKTNGDRTPDNDSDTTTVAQMEAILKGEAFSALGRDVGESALRGQREEGEGEGDQDKSPPLSELKLSDLGTVGVLARLIKVIRLPDDRLSALVQLVRRAQPIDIMGHERYLTLKVMYPADVVADESTFQAMYRQVRLHLTKFFDAHPAASDDLKGAAMSIDSPGLLADFVAQHLSRDMEERIGFLTETDLSKRMERALHVTLRELDLLTVGNRISQEIRDKVEKHQRDYILREQLKAIRGELGEEKDPAALAVQELRAKLDQAGLSGVAEARANEELKRLQLVPTESPEHNVVRSYLEWIASLPWSKISDDRRDIVQARKILDEDHYGLVEIKERIIEFLAVHQLNPNKTGSILCFAGPPGVGKTSLGQSIARALGREFYRFSVGGMRDEAEIKGHRRTYIGAMPGRILQGLRQVKTANPVFMLDELDKIGHDWRGDPSSALLEVLDPSQNKSFADHYLDLPFDLSRVMFIATANVETEIPAALRDRLEIIDLPGYIPEEKLEIAAQHLVPRQRKEHGLAHKQMQIGRPAVMRIVREYTHEAGVRELERLLAKICRKRATEVVRGDRKAVSITPDNITRYLGPPKIHDDRITKRPLVGVAIGLAWTPAGGDVLFIEMVGMPGKGQIKVTGHLGEVMSESAQLAVSYVRSRADDLGIDATAFQTRDFHLHFPAGAVKKDGPSAGVTITSALISLLTDRALPARVAMTGEMTLRGEVLPVGGIREKVVAARRAGVRTVIVPERNRADVEQIPEEVRSEITFVYASHYDDVRNVVFPDMTTTARTQKPAKKVRRKTPIKKAR